MKKSKFILVLISIITLVSSDLLIKYFISNNNTNIEVIKNFFSLKYVLNSGAAFSIFSNQTAFLIIISIVCFTFIIYEIKNSFNNNILLIGYSLVLSGLLGNFIDRLIDSYIIDYLSFKIFNYNFPIFNFADILIVSGIFIVLLYEFRGDKSEFRSK